MSTDNRSFIEHAQSQQRREDYWTRSETIEDTVNKCARALERGRRKHYFYVAQQLQNTLVPLLLTGQGKSPEDYDADLNDHVGWHFDALATFVESGALITQVIDPGLHNPSRRGELAALTQGMSDPEPAARDCIEGTFRSCSAIAENEGYIPRLLKRRVDAVGQQIKIAEHLQKPGMDGFGDPVELMSEESGQLKNLYMGTTGQGKSVSLESEAYDYFVREDVEIKLMDPLGFRDGENWFYDIPQQDEDLRQARADRGLPESWDAEDGADLPAPEMDLRVPLTPGLGEQNLPFDRTIGEFTPKPFTIPASDIPKSFLIAICTTRLTPEQEGVVRDAWDEVNFRRDDWTLGDLAEEIRTRDELSDSKKKPAVRTLKQLQNLGFIRTREDDYVLDWEEIYRDTASVTVFSQAFMDDLTAKLIVFGYLLNKMVEVRKDLRDVPQLGLICREFWKVAPHNRRQAFDQRAADLQDAIGHTLTQLTRENRHSGVNFLADTQQPTDLLKAIRENFNRFVTFSTNESTARKIVEWTSNDHWRSFYRSLNNNAGEASIIGMIGPAVATNKSQTYEFVGPVKYAPAPFHHRIGGGVDSNGWTARCKYLEHEELRRPIDVGVDWAEDDDVPTLLRVDTGYDEESDDPDINTSPVKVFAQTCLERVDGQSVRKADVRTAFNAFAKEEMGRQWDFDEHAVTSRFGTRLTNSLETDNDDFPGTTTKQQKSAYADLVLNRAGQEFLDKAMEARRAEDGEGAAHA